MGNTFSKSEKPQAAGNAQPNSQSYREPTAAHRPSPEAHRPAGREYTRVKVIRTYNEDKVQKALAELQLLDELKADQYVQDWHEARQQELLRYGISEPSRRLTKGLFPVCCTLKEMGVVKLLMIGRSAGGKSATITSIMKLFGQADIAASYSGGEGDVIVQDMVFMDENGKPNIACRNTKGFADNIREDEPAICEALIVDKLKDGYNCTGDWIEEEEGDFEDQCHGVIFVANSNTVEVYDPHSQKALVDMWRAIKSVVVHDQGMVPLTILTHTREMDGSEMEALPEYLRAGSKYMDSPLCLTYAVENVYPADQEGKVLQNLRTAIEMMLLETLIQAEYRILRKEVRELKETDPRKSCEFVPKYAVTAFLRQVAVKFGWPRRRLQCLEENIWAQWEEHDMGFDHEPYMIPADFQTILGRDENGTAPVFLSVGQRDQVNTEFKGIHSTWSEYGWVE